MDVMHNCSRCEGFIPAQASECPHCDATLSPRKTALRTLLNVAGGGAVAMTLMACYGGPPRDYAPPPRTPTTTQDCAGQAKDTDGDGYCAADCDEANPQVFPGAQDANGDGIDQNCDGKDG